MTRKEAEKLKVGDQVIFSDGVPGRVEQVGYCVATFKWDDGQQGNIHFDDMDCVSRDKSVPADARD